MKKTPVHFGKETLRAAQERLGLRNEDVAEAIGVAPRTYGRWLEPDKETGLDGLVPAGYVNSLVLALKLAKPPDLPEDTPQLGWLANEELDRLAELEERMQKLEARVGPDED